MEQKGFTLIELILVVVIIGILATMVFIALEGQGKRARLAAAATSIKSAISVATVCQSLGGTVSDPGSDVQGPSADSVCPDISQFSGESFWSKLPGKCYYCGKSSSTIYFQCSFQNCATAGAQKSSCDYVSGQCVIKDQ